MQEFYSAQSAAAQTAFADIVPPTRQFELDRSVADVLLVDGDPTASVDLWADPQANIRLLIQGGRVVRNQLT